MFKIFELWDSTRSGWAPVIESCEQSNELPGYIKDGKFPDQLGAIIFRRTTPHRIRSLREEAELTLTETSINNHEIMYKKFVTIRKVKSLGISLTDADTGT
jgi:hypothetical protein